MKNHLDLGFLGLWFGTGVLLVIPPLLVHPVPEEGGLIPFLFCPLLFSLVVPLANSVYSGDSDNLLFHLFIVPPLLLSHFVIVYFVYRSPSIPALLRGGIFLWAYATGLTGVFYLVRSAGMHKFTAQVWATLSGVVLNYSFLLLSPVVEFYSTVPSVRTVLIDLATRGNPVLILSGSILKQDLLRSSVMYEHIPIGRFYSYSTSEWSVASLMFLAIGLVGGLCFWLSER